MKTLIKEINGIRISVENVDGTFWAVINGEEVSKDRLADLEALIPAGKFDSKKLTFGYDIEDLEEAFSAVADPDDWKAPIESKISIHDLPVTVAAIKFYTATVPTYRFDSEGNSGKWIIESIGYRMGPAGDH